MRGFTVNSNMDLQAGCTCFLKTPSTPAYHACTPPCPLCPASIQGGRGVRGADIVTWGWGPDRWAQGALTLARHPCVSNKQAQGPGRPTPSAFKPRRTGGSWWPEGRWRREGGWTEGGIKACCVCICPGVVCMWGELLMRIPLFSRWIITYTLPIGIRGWRWFSVMYRLSAIGC